MIRVLVTGGSGQLATALDALRPQAAAWGLRLHRVGRPELDFDQPATLPRLFDRHPPDCVINAAAWTAVDAAEASPDAAFRANRDGPGHLARLCAAAGAPMIHLSTDYVFRGDKSVPYVETDPTGPTGVYGASKLAGEQAVLGAGGRAVVLRTAWVYAATGHNFLRTMLAAARTRPVLRVVADQQGCPTAAPDLAMAVLDVARQVTSRHDPAQLGVFHLAGAGQTTWHGFAAAIFESAARHGVSAPALTPIRSAEWPTPASRPLNSRLDCSKFAHVFGTTLPDWRRSLDHVIDTLFAALQH